MRLTCKTANGYCDMQIATRENKLEKLGQLEDIEDELGIDLVTLIKALESPKLWFIWKGSIMVAHKLNIFFFVDEKRVWFRFSGEFMPKVGHPFSDYGKTWALTREELE
jgi:hypothetical protein